MGNTLHQAAISGERVGIMVNYGVFGLIELCRKNLLRQRHTHGVAEALAQGPRGGLNTGRIAMLGMARCFAV